MDVGQFAGHGAGTGRFVPSSYSLKHFVGFPSAHWFTVAAAQAPAPHGVGAFPLQLLQMVQLPPVSELGADPDAESI